MDLSSTKYLRFSIRWDTILLNLGNTDAIKEALHISTGNHSRNDIEEMSFPHGVEVGEDGILNPETPAGGESTTPHGSGCKATTSGTFTQTLWFVRACCVLWFSIYTSIWSLFGQNYLTWEWHLLCSPLPPPPLHPATIVNTSCYIAAQLNLS